MNRAVALAALITLSLLGGVLAAATIDKFGQVNLSGVAKISSVNAASLSKLMGVEVGATVTGFHVYTAGSDYEATNEAGTIIYSGADPKAAVDAVLALATTGKTVTFTGTFYINDTITISGVYGAGRLTLNGAGSTFIHGNNLWDYPMIQITGTNIMLKSMNFDDEGLFPVGPAPYNTHAYSPCVLGGTDNILQNCTLDDCRRYGFLISGATNPTVQLNTIYEAQYDISGAGTSMNTYGGVIQNNSCLGFHNLGIKIKNMNGTIIRYNDICLNPIQDARTTIGIEFSDDGPTVNVEVCYNNIYRNLQSNPAFGAAGTAGTEGFYTDNGVNLSAGEVTTNNEIHHNTVSGTASYKVTRGGWLAGIASAYSDHSGSPTTYDFWFHDNSYSNITYSENYVYDYGYYNLDEDGP